MLSVSGLTKYYDARPVVQKISFDIKPGEIVGLLGPNGAGKTTTLRMIAGVLEPDGGTVFCNGIDMWSNRQSAQELMGYLPEGAPLYGEMSAAHYLDFLAQMRGFTRMQRQDKIAKTAHHLSLQNVLGQPIETLSKGYKRRVALAAAILHDPPILVLDEPTDGLDPNQKREARALLRSLAQGRVLLISTHILEDVALMCTRAIVVAEGKICADATPQELGQLAPSGQLDDAFLGLTLPGNLATEPVS